MRMVHEWFQDFCIGHMSTSDADIQRQRRLDCCIYSRKDQALENQKAMVQDGCCVCSHSAKNEIICQGIIVVTLLWTKHGYTTKRLRQRNSPNNELLAESLHQKEEHHSCSQDTQKIILGKG